MSNRNDFREIWLRMERAERDALADRVGSTYAYLQRLSGGFKMPSLRFAQRLKVALPRMTMDGFERAAAGAGKRTADGSFKAAFSDGAAAAKKRARR